MNRYQGPRFKKIEGGRGEISKLAIELRTYDVTDFMKHAPLDLIEKVMSIHGSSYLQFLSSCLEHARISIFKEQIKDRWQVLLDYCNTTEYDPKEINEWKEWFNKQSIDVYKFVNDLESLLLCKHPKKNTLRLWGRASTGKTMIVRAIGEPFLCHFQGMCGAHSDFAFEGLLNVTVGIVEEAFFIPKEVEDWKTIMSGQSLTVNKKYLGKQTIQRTPLLMTSNHYKLGRGYVKMVDEHACRTRIYDYHANIEYAPSIKLTGAGFSAFINELIGRQ